MIVFVCVMFTACVRLYRPCRTAEKHKIFINVLDGSMKKLFPRAQGTRRVVEVTVPFAEKKINTDEYPSCTSHIAICFQQTMFWNRTEWNGVRKKIFNIDSKHHVCEIFGNPRPKTLYPFISSYVMSLCPSSSTSSLQMIFEKDLSDLFHRIKYPSEFHSVMK